MITQENDRIVANPIEARGGVTGHKARFVLFFSTAAVVVLFAAVYLFFFVS
jgi:hypothetical protein